jgi:hypothetical protein
MKTRNYIYIENGDDAVGAADDAIMFPAENITRIDPTNATTTTVSFMAHDGTADTDKIVLTHASLKNKEVAAAVVKMAQFMPRDGFTIMAAFNGTGGVETFPINNLDSTIAVTNVQYTAS